MRSLFHSSTVLLQQNLNRFEMLEALRDETGLLWLDILVEPGKHQEVGDLLKEVFNFHPLALEDALQETHVPRVDNWKDYLYLNLQGIGGDVVSRFEPHELDVFVGRNYLVSLREHSISGLDTTWDQCLAGDHRRLSSGPDYLLYILLDLIVERFMPVVESLDDHIEDVEQDIFNHPSPRLVSRIFRLRRKLLRFRRVLGAMREVANRLARDDYEVIDQRDRIYFRDVYDHLVRLFEIIEGMRDMVVGALDSYLSVSSNRINEVMRTLTIFTVLFMPISFLAGFFGMNFFGDQFAIANPVSANVVFWMCMILMVSIPPAMVWWMAKRGWLQPTIYGRVKEREQHALLEPRNHRNA